MSRAPGKYVADALVVEGVSFTEFQVKWIVDTATDTREKRNFGSTQVEAVRKIELATGRRMKPVPLACWFAYAQGLVKL